MHGKCLFLQNFQNIKFTLENTSYLLLHVVTLPDHVPSVLHERKGEPAIRYPVLQASEACEPNEYAHEREVIDP